MRCEAHFAYIPGPSGALHEALGWVQSKEKYTRMCACAQAGVCERLSCFFAQVRTGTGCSHACLHVHAYTL
eukprot:1156630-Pelagomonas_calceolata.AAC.2